MSKSDEIGPYIDGNKKEWCKEFADTMVKKELGKLEVELLEIIDIVY